jgi:hypothetical protein
VGKQITNPNIYKSLSASAASWESDELSIRKLDIVGLQLNWSNGSSPVGTCKVQATIDGENWVDLVMSSELAVSGASGSHLFNIGQIPFDKIKFVYTRSSGSADFELWMMSKTIGH